MKILITVLLLVVAYGLASSAHRAEARSAAACSNLFVFKDSETRHFLAAQEFYRNPIDPDTMKSDSLIVVTEPLLKKLTTEPSKALRAFLVVDTNGLTQTRFKSLMAQHYQMEVTFRTEFTTGFQNVEVRGSSENLLRFLMNPYAKRSVLWAGQQEGDRYIDHVQGFFGDPWDKGAAMHLNGGRSFLEPMRPPSNNGLGRGLNNGSGAIDNARSGRRSSVFEEGRARDINDFSDLF